MFGLWKEYKSLGWIWAENFVVGISKEDFTVNVVKYDSNLLQ
jgi:hypothetical protein